jgi:glucokinase
MSGFGSVALGLDIGGTKTKLGIVDNTGMVTGFRSFPTRARGTDPNRFLQDLSENIAKVLASTGIDVIGIGVCAHGYIDDERRGPIICENTPAIRGFDLHAWLEEKFGLPVLISNDLAAHAMAEYSFGVGRGTRRFMAMAVGTGIGAGVVVDGKPLRFVGGTTGDTGRVILKPGEPECVYGVSGSAESLCGTAFIERQAEAQYGKRIPAHEVIYAARDGSDPIAVDIIRQVGEHLGWTLSSLCSIFLPEKVALTGGTIQAGRVLLEACRSKFEEMVGDYHRKLVKLSGGYYQGVEIELGEYCGESGVVGAVVELLGPELDREQ